MTTEALVAAVEELRIMQRYLEQRQQTIGLVLAARESCSALSGPTAAATSGSFSLHPASPEYMQPPAPTAHPADYHACLYEWRCPDTDPNWKEWYCKACSRWATKDHVATDAHKASAQAHMQRVQTDPAHLAAPARPAPVPLPGPGPPYDAARGAPAASAPVRLTPAYETEGRRFHSRSPRSPLGIVDIRSKTVAVGMFSFLLGLDTDGLWLWASPLGLR